MSKKYGLCPHCAYPIQATHAEENYYTFDEKLRAWAPKLTTESSIRYYCENDCELTCDELKEVGVPPISY